ncbi:MAG: (2Fe-2S) ferredoxin domain-containing protein, partial [Prevotella sp.]|nr:(2Fe-2S) ferredoxin domain-containing protein [Prevotella sp.]
MRIQSREDLKTLRKQAMKRLELRVTSQDNTTGECCGLNAGTTHLQILTCGGTGCQASGGDYIFQRLSKEVASRGLTEQVDVVCTGCFGFCEKGPIVKIIPDNTFYTQVREEDVDEIIDRHIVGAERVKRLLYTDP